MKPVPPVFGDKPLSCGPNQNRKTMIEKDGKLWYTQLEAANFLGCAWRTMANMIRKHDSIEVCKIACQNYYEFESLARYNQDHQRPSKRRDLTLWRHPELKNRELISDEDLRRDYYSTKEAREILKLDYGCYERFYTIVTNNNIGSFPSGRRKFWLKTDIDALKERLDASTDISEQQLSELRQKVADLSRANEKLKKENITFQYKLDMSEKECQKYREKYMHNKDIEKVRNGEISLLNARLSHLTEFCSGFLKMAFAIAGFSLNNREKNTLRLYFEGLDFGEIAMKRHSDEDSVRNMFYRSLEKIEVYMKDIAGAKEALYNVQQAMEENKYSKPKKKGV